MPNFKTMCTGASSSLVINTQGGGGGIFANLSCFIYHAGV